MFAGWVVYSYHISLMSWHEPLHGFSPNQYIVQLFVKNSKFGTFIQYGKCLFFQAAKALKTKRNPCPSIQAPIFPEKKEEKLAYFASPPLFSRDGNAGACDASISILEGGNVWEELEVISGMSGPAAARDDQVVFNTQTCSGKCMSVAEFIGSMEGLHTNLP